MKNKVATKNKKLQRSKHPHVCSVKGKYNGRKGQGKRYAGSGKVGFGCELKQGLAIDNGKRLKFAFKKDQRVKGPSIITYSKDGPPRGYIEALPCQEVFLNKNSHALKAYIKAFPESVLFKEGCQALENSLRDEKLVSHSAYDGDRAPELMNFSTGDSKGQTVFAVDNFIRFNNFFKANHEADRMEKLLEGLIDESSPFHYSSVLGHFMGPSPVDLKHSILREMIEEKYFLEKPDGHALQTTAFIIDRGFNTENNRLFIKALFPDYDEEKFKSLEATIGLEVSKFLFDKDKELKHLFKRFKEAWEKLTTKQQNILKRTLLNPEKETAKDIAKNLKLKESSVIDRKKKAIAAIKKAFPELVEKLKSEKRISKTELYRYEIQYDGLFRLSQHEKLRPCKITNHKTGKVDVVTQKRIKLKPEDPKLKEKVWEWINKTSPEIYPSSFN